MSVFTPGPPVIAGVDTVLRILTRDAVSGLLASVIVTVGPLDRPGDAPRLNWFLYRVDPSAAFRNMEPPQTGWGTRRGRPPLALTLRYLLTADPGELSEEGEEDDTVHAALTAVMSALHDAAILGPATRIADSPDRTVADVAPALDGLVEPLRITAEAVPFDALTALWSAESVPFRLSVGYEVSLVIVPSQAPFVAASPVQQRRIGVAPSPGPRLLGVSPERIHSGRPVEVAVTGLAATFTATLERLPEDPPDPLTPAGPWTLTATSSPAGLTATLPSPALAPGRRILRITNHADGLAAGSASAAVTIAPYVLGGGPLTAGAPATLDAAHVLVDGEAIIAGIPVPYARTHPTSVTLTVPALPPGATRVPVSLRSGAVSGPPRELEVAP